MSIGTGGYLRTTGLRGLGAASVFLLLSACGDGTTAPVLATILSVKGEAEWQTTAGGPYQPLLPESHPGAGQALRTRDMSRIAVALLPNALAELRSDTKIDIVRLLLTKDGNETDDAYAMIRRIADFRLVRGRIFVLHRKRGAVVARSTLKTSHGIVTAKADCLFYVETENERMRVLCAEGEVEYQRSDGDVPSLLQAGFVGEAALGAYHVFPADADVLTQQQLVAAWDTGSRLRDLRRNLQKQSPDWRRTR